MLSARNLPPLLFAPRHPERLLALLNGDYDGKPRCGSIVSVVVVLMGRTPG